MYLLESPRHGTVNEKIHDPDFCADRFDVITNFAVIKECHYKEGSLIHLKVVECCKFVFKIFGYIQYSIHHF